MDHNVTNFGNVSNVNWGLDLIYQAKEFKGYTSMYCTNEKTTIIILFIRTEAELASNSSHAYTRTNSGMAMILSSKGSFFRGRSTVEVSLDYTLSLLASQAIGATKLLKP